MIVIIGAGLSGLLIAHRLKKSGIPFKILEARNRVGGRIYTKYGSNATPVELGATWFNKQHRHLVALLEELEIDYFEQHMDTSVFYQTSPYSSAQIVSIPSQPKSYRISGGTSHLINTLVKIINPQNILLNQTVTDIGIHEDSILVKTKTTFTGSKVVLAIPPKLWANKILFKPELPNDLMNIAKLTHTWMEDSIKIALTYTEPFWQDQKNPGTLFNNSGPITELYDHCNHKRSKYALCGFINSSFKNLTYEERRTSVLRQMETVYGKKALEFIDYEELLWGNEEHTFEASHTFLYPHQNNGNPIFNKTYMDHKLLISCTESAQEFPGYMDGAVLSANATAEKIIKSNLL